MGDFMGLRKNFFPQKPLVIKCFSLTFKAIVWQVFPCKTFWCSRSDLRISFSQITYTTPPPLKSQMVGPHISSLHMIGHISVLHNHCETHQGPVIIYPLEISRNSRTQKGGSLKTLEGFREGTTQICLENEHMWWVGGGERRQGLWKSSKVIRWDHFREVTFRGEIG